MEGNDLWDEEVSTVFFPMKDEPDEGSRNQMSEIVNGLFEERMNKHHLLDIRRLHGQGDAMTVGEIKGNAGI